MLPTPQNSSTPSPSPALPLPPLLPPTIISTTRDPAHAPPRNLIPNLAALHQKCILDDATIATFLPPLGDEKMMEYWSALVRQCGGRAPMQGIAAADTGTGGGDPVMAGGGERDRTAGERVIVYIAEEGQGGVEKEGRIAGVVSLWMPWSETGDHRAWVEKLMVDGRFRQRGVARRLMGEVERLALEKGKWLLLLDTETGSKAEKVYPRLGYVEYGKIPLYSVSPEGRVLKSETFFYKNLRTVQPVWNPPVESTGDAGQVERFRNQETLDGV